MKEQGEAQDGIGALSERNGEGQEQQTLRILCGVLRLQWLGRTSEGVGRSMPHRIALNGTAGPTG